MIRKSPRLIITWQWHLIVALRYGIYEAASGTRVMIAHYEESQGMSIDEKLEVLLKIKRCRCTADGPRVLV